MIYEWLYGYIEGGAAIWVKRVLAKEERGLLREGMVFLFIGDESGEGGR
ncbi:hypothetical protein [Bacillus licheniformis]|nr:hypothetical protein [Bacillus licheniformis]